MKKKQLKRIFRILFIITSISSLWFVPWILVKAWILPLPDTVQEQVEEAISHGVDGMIVYVDEAGKPPAFYAAGWHDRENKIPANPNALFKIGSITKLYVAVAATKLIKTKHLSLDKTLADYFPELIGRIENANEITLRMMLQHRSGIPNFTDHTDYWVNPPDARQEKLEYALDLPASFKPDKGYEYSNTNYMLISDLIDKVLGYSHQQYIKEEILIPLNLNNTFGSLHNVNINDVMSGYYVGIENDIKTDYSGLMIATAQDVGVFLRALNDGSVFNEGEQEIYSYVYEHGGLLPGYQCLAEYHNEIDTVVVQFMNTTNFDGYNWNLSQIVINRIVKIIKCKKDQ
ncbi:MULTISPECIES: serine hydrolase domain-containing protein [Bizionia]|uniref:Beta-lactamase family protein n=1 Tax=Bizionia algoritergicola TaxID=291187 RepID=A0A5D0QPC8_9FLAO|nr:MULTISPECIES: serine hydrolase domain-containing protein [Bizionia]OBX22346.1 serine hydrolase [Bizionia sp. APA-3]TYB70561.1 beta-lactamase family protein [Bizionia algoritergicola]